jgi:hypothetical protein
MGSSFTFLSALFLCKRVPFVRLRRANGTSFGPVKVTKGDSDSIATLDAPDLAAVETAQSITLADVLARADGSEYPTFELGTADNQSRLVKVLGVSRTATSAPWRWWWMMSAFMRPIWDHHPSCRCRSFRPTARCCWQVSMHPLVRASPSRCCGRAGFTAGAFYYRARGV